METWRPEYFQWSPKYFVSDPNIFIPDAKLFILNPHFSLGIHRKSVVSIDKFWGIQGKSLGLQ